jgi:two-component system, NtrC family, response regulator
VAPLASIVVIDDDPVVNKLICKALRPEGHECHPAFTLSQGLEIARQTTPDLVFLDLSMPDGNGLAWLNIFMEVSSDPEVIVITGTGSEKSIEESISQGAWDYVQKPISVRSVLHLARQALRYRKDKGVKKELVALKLSGIVGESHSLYRCLQQVAQAALSSAPCAIHGETGVGKELVARTIHANSDRHDGPFVVVDCASLSESLAGSALFGHLKGSFTGAHTNKAGLIESAQGGVLFLDEIGELPLDIQKQFLRVLQEQKFRPIGGVHEIESDFRLISATHRDLSAMADEKLFRQDLLYRIMGHRVLVPSLRERMEDMEMLAAHFIKIICRRNELPVKDFSPDFIPALKQYRWPGNIRELINCLENAIASAGQKPMLYPQDLPAYLRVSIRSGKSADVFRVPETLEPPPVRVEAVVDRLSNETPEQLPTLKDARNKALEIAEKEYLKQLLASSGGTVDDLCVKADVSRPHFYALLRKYDLPSPKRRGA